MIYNSIYDIPIAVHAAQGRLQRGSRSACDSSLPSKDTTFRCAICKDGVKTCTCPYGHHNQPIKRACE